MWEDELEAFVRRSSLPALHPGSEGVVWTTLLDGKVELAIDASRKSCASVYALVQLEHPGVMFLLKGLQLCDPAKIVGSLLHCVADGGDRVGFLINLDRDQMHADALCAAMAQILQALVRMQQG
ncbi:MAG: hypothetical protein LBT98_00750 [Puniceicoccales bacterium]|nr:hypothetical protein [Puniceicoccales bacterium]